MNNNDNKEENQGSLFSRFEDALDTMYDDDEIVEDVPAEQEESRQSDGPEFPRRKRHEDSPEENKISESRTSDSEANKARDEIENRLRRNNQLDKELPKNGGPENPSSPSSLARNRLNNPNMPKAGADTAKNAGELAKNGGKLAKTGGDLAKGAGQVGKGAADTAKTVGTVGKGAVDAAGAVGAVGKGAVDTAGAVGTVGATTAGGTAAAAATTTGGAVAIGGVTTVAAESTNPVGWVALGIEAGTLAVLLLVGAFAAVVTAIIVMGVFTAVYKNSLTDIKMQDGYALINTDMCEYVTVTNSDYAGTYPLETYVAGVVQGEVGFFGNDTVNKALAIAARGYFYTHNSNCSIAGNTTKQVYKPPTAATMAAARATEGVMVISGGSVLSTEYDAFAYKSEDNNYYYLHQQNQAIPIEWAKAKGITNSLSTYKKAYHGRGMSQWGALYLAETGKSYEAILKYYYGSDVTLAKVASALTFNANYQPTVTSKNNILHQPLDQFLSSRGSSVAQVNQSIFNSVNNAGYGTGKGVAAAAYSLVTVLDQNFGIRLPYAHGGHAVYMNSPTRQNYMTPLGVDGAWGTRVDLRWGTKEKYGQVDTNSPYYGIDCNGFAQWAIYNGGFKYIHVYTDAASMSKYGSTCRMTDSNCNGEPGDLLVNGGHVVVIVGATDTNYIIAQSGSQSTGIYITNKAKHSDGSYSVVKMKSFYNNSSNRR